MMSEAEKRAESTAAASGHSTEVVTEILTLYASLVRGQLVAATPEERLAAVICAAEVLAKANPIAITKLAMVAGRPAWLLKSDKIESTARAIAEKMVG